MPYFVSNNHLTMFLVVGTNNIALFLIFIQIPVYLLHQFGEHAWPGGLKIMLIIKFSKQVIQTIL